MSRCASISEPVSVTPGSPGALINRELSWLSFARRVLALAEDPGQPVLERVKFAGIMGMIYDEFAMKRIGGLFRQVRKGGRRRGPDGLTGAEVLEACRAELRSQQELVATLVEAQLQDPRLIRELYQASLAGVPVAPGRTHRGVPRPSVFGVYVLFGTKGSRMGRH